MNPSHDLQGLKKKTKETFLYVLSALLLGIAIGAIDAVWDFPMSDLESHIPWHTHSVLSMTLHTVLPVQ